MLSDDDEWIHDVDPKLIETWPKTRPYRARDRLERERQIAQAVDEAVKRADGLQAQNAELTGQLQQKDVEIEDLKQKAAQLSADLDATATQANTFREELALRTQDEGELERLRQQIGMLEADLNGAVMRANALQAQNVELLQTEEEARQLKQRVGELEVDLEEAKKHPKVVVLEDTRPMDVQLQELMQERDFYDRKYQSTRQRYEVSRQQLEFMRSCQHALAIFLVILLAVVLFRLQ
ncbi:hypothetical protein AURDEDRAFT_157096 [Auricularia subglabra TFB-10046 SS5]|nr:hypothetical protein AURDEDRAFT_157096 [Auricularia subglabra TFB-10046 SS5]